VRLALFAFKLLITRISREEFAHLARERRGAVFIRAGIDPYTYT